MNGTLGYRTFARVGRYAALGALWLMATQFARADMFVSETELVSGTGSSVESFTVTTAESVTVQLSNIPWPQSLSSLSFMLSSADQVLASWSTDDSTVETYQLTPGTYYAHVTGTAAGSFDLGLYSLSIGTQPAAVPLPPGGTLLIGALLVLLVLGWLPRSDPSVQQALLTSG